MRKANFILSLWLVIVAGCSEKDGNYGNHTREELRYYAYAPPTIPHPVINPDCLDCHEMGLVVDGFQAPVTPHPQLVACQQCHIHPGEGVKLFQDNSFVGLRESKSLPLPQPAGPPVMPHRAFMRENCSVCHDDSSRTGIIQTTHPERENCRQCHVPLDPGIALFRQNTEMKDLY